MGQQRPARRADRRGIGRAAGEKFREGADRCHTCESPSGLAACYAADRKLGEDGQTAVRRSIFEVFIASHAFDDFANRRPSVAAALRHFQP
jgi:hypothetical protein